MAVPMKKLPRDSKKHKDFNSDQFPATIRKSSKKKHKPKVLTLCNNPATIKGAVARSAENEKSI